MKVRCSICGKIAEMPGRRSGKGKRIPCFFPFCSERCKLIDLAAWLNGEYRIPEEPEEQDEKGGKS